MSFLLRHLRTGWDVDQAILWDKEKLVAIRFGYDYDPNCMIMDKMLASIAEKVKNFVTIYLVDIKEVPYFNKMYELVDTMNLMFFFKNRVIKCDYGTGEHNRMNFIPNNKQELIDICELLYTTAKKGAGKAISPINYANHNERKTIINS